MAEAPRPRDADETAADIRPARLAPTAATAWSTGKGRVGKTTTSVHLGALPSDRALIMDTDPAPRLDHEDRNARGRRAAERATNRYDVVLVDPDDPTRTH